MKLMKAKALADYKSNMIREEVDKIIFIQWPFFWIKSTNIDVRILSISE